MKIIFLGTPSFAVPSLDVLIKNGYNVVGVITIPDKSAGRGQKLQESEVKQYALKNNLRIFQPVKLSDPLFLEEIKSLNADLQIVVAFRMLPEKLWSMPPLGTFNLHGSLLPNYRGAAPINRAIMNGETETGVTTFFLKHEIDTGNIIFQEKILIGGNETAGDVHDRLMFVGANLVLKTVEAIEKGEINAIDQNLLMRNKDNLKISPKLFKEDCKIDFSNSIQTINNQIRGLSPYPGAFFELKLNDGTIQSIKVYQCKIQEAGTVLTHELLTDGKNSIMISAADGFILPTEIQIPGKKRMKIDELLRGYSFPKDAVIL